MKKKWMRRICMLLVLSLLAGVSAPSEVQAAKAYGDSLELNNNLVLNKTKTFTKTGYCNNDPFKKKEKVKIKYTVKCSRKSSGKNYKTTYKVTWKYLNNPKTVDKVQYDDWYWPCVSPESLFTVFDYQTGKSLAGENDLGVKVKKTKDWKVKFYPKQYFINPAQEEKGWWRNLKTESVTFTVTYPKTCKDVCVGIGFISRDHKLELLYEDLEYKNQSISDYEGNAWGGKIINNTVKYNEGLAPYGKSLYYKKGKDTMSYMRLNK